MLAPASTDGAKCRPARAVGPPLRSRLPRPPLVLRCENVDATVYVSDGARYWGRSKIIKGDARGRGTRSSFPKLRSTSAPMASQPTHVIRRAGSAGVF